LPLLLNQWANVVRWEMRTRMFLRTSEFLWQEGHTAHETREDAMAETLRALEMYRAFAEEDASIPVVVGEKPANERFPGAEATFSIEAMMQDGKALQAGTSHYLGTSFAEAANIRFQDREGAQQFCHTTSWGVSTRMVGAMIMVHGDDDGLRVPPTLAPFQVLILPMLREDDGDAALLAYCEELRAALLAQSAFGEPLRVLLDAKPGKAAAKRWDWVRKGAPLIVEVGPRDMADGKGAVLRRDRLWSDAAKPDFAFTPRDEIAAKAPVMLVEIQRALYDQAVGRREANMVRDIDSLDALRAFFAEEKRFPGWAEVQWSRPDGAALDKVVEQLKALKLTFRIVPADGAPASGTCLFTGAPAVERILVARAY
jgi:prolyl-tRNA synthetase